MRELEAQVVIIFRSEEQYLSDISRILACQVIVTVICKISDRRTNLKDANSNPIQHMFEGCIIIHFIPLLSGIVWPI